MKRVIWNVLAGAFMAAALTACGGSSGSSGGSSGGGKSAKITMTTEAGEGFYFYLRGSGVATVDWGDGSENVSLTLNEPDNPLDGVRFEHTYPSATIRTITVNGDNITYLSCSNITSLDVSRNTELTYLVVYGNLTSLDLSKNTALTDLIVVVNGQHFTGLDVSRNTALTYLSVGGNFTGLDVSKNTALTDLRVSGQLTASALNALFGTLHSNVILGETKTIQMSSSNPGYSDCDRSIAESKGWRVPNY